MDDPTFLDLFWNLSNASSVTRISSAQRLVEKLKIIRHQSSLDASSHSSSSVVQPAEGRSKCGGDFKYRIPVRSLDVVGGEKFLVIIEYTVNRLIHSLSSGRDCVRLGYATALLAVAKEFPKVVTASSLADAVHMSTLVNGTLSSGEQQKDLGLGCIFGYQLLRGLGFFRTTLCLTQLPTVLKDLCGVFGRKVYFQDTAAFVLSEVALDCETHSPGLALKILNEKCAKWFALVKHFRPSFVTASTDAEDPSAKHGGHVAPFGFVFLYLRLYRGIVLKASRSQAVHSFFQKDPLCQIDQYLDILSSQSILWCLHPKVAAAWKELVVFFLHHPDDTTSHFKQVLNYVMTHFFGEKTEELDPTAVTSVSLQRLFSGFRIMLEILATLKEAFVVTGADQPPSEVSRLAEFSTLYWSNSLPFLKRILICLRQKHPLSNTLQQAARSCLQLLAQIVNGFDEEPRTRKRENAAIPSAVDVASSGIYTLNGEKNVGHYDNENESALSLYRRIVRSPMSSNIALDPEILLLCCVKRGSSYTKFDVPTLTRLVEISVDTLDAGAREKFVSTWLNATEKTSVEEWLWKFDFASQAVSSSKTLSLPQKGRLAATMFLSTIATAAFRVKLMKNNHGPKLPPLLNVALTSSDVECVVPFFSCDDEELQDDEHLAQRTAVCRRLLSRISPVLGRLWCFYEAKFSRYTSVLRSNKWGNEISPETMDKLQCVTNALQALESFFADFFTPILVALNALFGFKSKSLSKLDATVFQRDHLSAENESSNYSGYCTQAADFPICLVFSGCALLSHSQAQLCVAFGVLAKKVMKKLGKKVKTLTDVAAMRKGAIEAKPYILFGELLMTVHGFTALALRPFLLSSAATSHKTPESFELIKPFVDPVATLDLLQQMAQGVLLELAETPFEKNESLLLDSVRAFADVVPDLLLEVSSTAEVRFEGVAECAYSASRGLLSSVITPLWRTLCRYASEECVTSLVNSVIQESTDCNAMSDNDDDDALDMSDTDEDNDSGSTAPSVSHVSNRSEDENSGSEESSVTGESGSGTDEEEDAVEVIQSGDVAALLLNDDSDLPGVPKTLQVENFREKKRLKQRMQCMGMHYQLRRVEILQCILEAVVADMSQSGALVSYSRLLQQFNWQICLLQAFKTHLNRVLRCIIKKKALNQSKKIAAGLQQDLSRRFESLVSRYVSRFLNLLGCQKRVLGWIEPVDTVATALQHWDLLRKHMRTVLDVCCKPLNDLGRLRSPQSLRCEELGALLLLVGGRLEELLWSLGTVAFGDEVYYEHLQKHIKVLKLCILTHKASKAPNTELPSSALLGSNLNGLEDSSTSSTVARKTEFSPTSIPSSGLLLCDTLTEALCVWTQESHPVIGERFFRSLSSLSQQHFGGNCLLGLLGTPFVPAATRAGKLFVVREAIAAHGEILALLHKTQLKHSSEEGSSWIVHSPSCALQRGFCTWRRLVTPLLSQHLLEHTEKLFTSQGIKKFKSFDGLVVFVLGEALTFLEKSILTLGQKDAQQLYAVRLNTSSHSQRAVCLRQWNAAAKRYSTIVKAIAARTLCPTATDIPAELERLADVVLQHGRSHAMTYTRRKRSRTSTTA